MIRLIAAALIALLFCVGGQVKAGESRVSERSAGSGMKCYDRVEFQRALGSKLRLFSVGRGLNAFGNVTELWLGTRDFGWVLVVLTPEGRACPLDYGSDWQSEFPRSRCAGWQE